jgi:uncharacterized protein
MEVKDLFKLKNWVVAGDVLNGGKYASKIYEKLGSIGFTVSGVNPNYRGKNIETEGKRVYQSLSEVPHGIEVIDLCINPEVGFGLVKEARDLNIKFILIQPGAESTEILEYCKKWDIKAIQGCALTES